MSRSGQCQLQGQRRLIHVAHLTSEAAYLCGLIVLRHPMTINELWHSGNAHAWNQALERYMRFVKPADVELIR